MNGFKFYESKLDPGEIGCAFHWAGRIDRILRIIFWLSPDERAKIPSPPAKLNHFAFN